METNVKGITEALGASQFPFDGAKGIALTMLIVSGFWLVWQLP